jgi:hypothetical protein
LPEQERKFACTSRFLKTINDKPAAGNTEDQKRTLAGTATLPAMNRVSAESVSRFLLDE